MDEAALLTLLRYGFLTAIYLFLFVVVRAIYRDLRITSGGGYVAAGVPPAAAPPPRAAPPPILQRLEGDSPVDAPLLLDRPVTSFGRHPDNDVVLASRLASGHHFRIRVTADGAAVEDLASTNGTLLNGERVVGEAPLQPGDRISAGEVVFVFQPPGEP